jgi:dihydrofolate synthase/folylpolyglutamate synthase
MTYDQSVRYLLSLGRELASPQQARAAKFDLQNIRTLSARLGSPHQRFRSVHVAGTNGKGSTSAMLAAILEAAGLRAGLYTSPHLVRINERIRIGQTEISDADFAATFTRIHAAIEELLASGALAAHPTYFECVTAMAFDYFSRQNVDLAVIEVGMGGRLDSTNIIVPELAIITKIDFDHENFLGHSIEQIAAEKAGIIKPAPDGSAGPGAWVVSNPGNSTAAEIIRRRAAEQNARLLEVETSYAISNVTALDGCYCFTAIDQHSDWQIEISLPLPGRFQIQNALTAIAAARLLAQRGLGRRSLSALADLPASSHLGERGFPITDTAIANGLASVRWPGRIQHLQDGPAVYLDGTHNPAGARELAAFWEEQFRGRRIHLIYGAMRDKAVDEVAGLLFPRAATVILTQSPQPRSISAETLASLTRHLAPNVEVIPDPAAALDRALHHAAPDDIVFAAGSLYLVGHLLRYWNTRRSGAASVHSAMRQ